MKPLNTKYRLATSSRDYQRCRQLFEENQGEPPSVRLSFPTVLAERDGSVIGFLSTHPSSTHIMAGPLEVKGGRNMITFIRLIEAYENVLRAAGVASFMFYTRAEREDSFAPKRVEAYKDFGVKFLRFDRGNAVFWKDIQNGQQ